MPSRLFVLPLRLAGVTVIAFGFTVAGGACVMSNRPTVERHPDGSYKLTCRTALPQCLEKAEEVCKGTRYVVTRAADHHDYMGGQGTVGETQVRTSEAVFVCGKRGKSLWGKDADPMAVSSAPGDGAGAGAGGAPAVAAGAGGGRACVPGATQQCLGPAACRGGQSCLADGSGFSPCDCGDGSRAASSADGPPAGASQPQRSPEPSPVPGVPANSTPTPTPAATPASPRAGGAAVAPPPSGNPSPPR